MYFIEQIDNVLDFMGKYFVFSLILLHLIYLFGLIGVVSLNSELLQSYNIIIQTFVCTFLIIKYNPLRKHVFNPNDGRIIFSTAIFLLLNLGIMEYLKEYITDYSNKMIKSDMKSTL